MRERRRQTIEEGGERERARERGGVFLMTEAISMARRPQEREKDHGR